MKKQLLTLVILLTSFTTFAQFQDTACRKLDVDHGIYKLGHDYNTQYITLQSIGFNIWTVDSGYMPGYTLAQQDSFSNEPYYKLLQVLGYGGPYITATNVLTVPVEAPGDELDKVTYNYSDLIRRLSKLSPEMSMIEPVRESYIDEMTKLIEFKVDGQLFEWEVEVEGNYIDESFIHFFQEIVMNYMNSDKGQLCWFMSMDDEEIVFMWLTSAQMKYMNETLHLHRIVFS